MTGDATLAAQVKRDYRGARLEAKTRALLDYAVEVTLDAASVRPETIEALRKAGWSDEEILTATHIIGFFNYYARLADALGVEPEDFMTKDLSG
ncbi:MAG: peroxidase [Acidobacteria bacterium]|nr:peroxidase [Acidobacteriota bacterium]